MSYLQYNRLFIKCLFHLILYIAITTRSQKKMERLQQQQTQLAENPRMKKRRKPVVKDLNEHIVCPLCRGYLIDATTLVECLHSCEFCLKIYMYNINLELMIV